MLAFDATRTSDLPTARSFEQITVHVSDLREPAMVRSCSRLGLSANPPGFSFSDWLQDR
jgi:hypothetical protein